MPFGDDQPARRRAALPGLEERAVDRDRHRRRQIRVVEHDERVLAAHLELHARAGLDRGGADADADVLRSGEAHRVDVGRRGERGAELRAGPHHQVEHAGRQAGALHDVDERPRRRRHELGRLEDDAVAERERRRDLPRRNRERKIPRRDQADDAERLARDLDFDAGPHRVELVAA